MSYFSVKWRDSDGRFVTTSYDISNGSAADQVAAANTITEAMDDVSKLFVESISLVISVPKSGDYKVAPVSGSSVQDEFLGMYAESEAGYPFTAYVPDLIDSLIGAGGQVINQQPLTDLLNKSVLPGAGIRLADSRGSKSARVRFLNLKSSGKRVKNKKTQI